MACKIGSNECERRYARLVCDESVNMCHVARSRQCRPVKIVLTSSQVDICRLTMSRLVEIANINKTIAKLN